MVAANLAPDDQTIGSAVLQDISDAFALIQICIHFLLLEVKRSNMEPYSVCSDRDRSSTNYQVQVATQ